MQSPILHIGYPKTGTTWFYDSFYPHVRNSFLAPPSSYLPCIAKETFHPPRYDETKRLIMVHPELTGIKNFVWEYGVNRDKILKNLKSNFPNATIVLFIRNQLSFLTSAYIYYVRKGGTYSANKFFSLVKEGKLAFTLDFLHFNEMIDACLLHYPKEQVQVYLFEDFCNNPKEFILNYNRMNTFEIDAEKINFRPINEKLRIRFMKFLRFTNHYTRLDNPLKKYYINLPFIYSLLNEQHYKWNKFKIFGNKTQISDLLRSEHIDFINEYFIKHNRILIEKHELHRIKDYNYPL